MTGAHDAEFTQFATARIPAFRRIALLHRPNRNVAELGTVLTTFHHLRLLGSDVRPSTTEPVAPRR